MLVVMNGSGNAPCSGKQLDNAETPSAAKATRTAGTITIGSIQSPLYVQFESKGSGS